MPFSEELVTHRRRGTNGTAGSVQGYGLGDVSFTTTAADHAVATRYEARVRVSGSSTVVVTKDIGKPQPDASNVIRFNLRAILDAQTAGDYTVSVAAYPSGNDSTATAAFLVPLQAP